MWFTLGIIVGFVGFVIVAVVLAARDGHPFGDDLNDVFDTDP